MDIIVFVFHIIHRFSLSYHKHKHKQNISNFGGQAVFFINIHRSHSTIPNVCSSVRNRMFKKWIFQLLFERESWNFLWWFPEPISIHCIINLVRLSVCFAAKPICSISHYVSLPIFLWFSTYGCCNPYVVFKHCPLKLKVSFIAINMMKNVYKHLNVYIWAFCFEFPALDKWQQKP